MPLMDQLKLTAMRGRIATPMPQNNFVVYLNELRCKNAILLTTYKPDLVKIVLRQFR